MATVTHIFTLDYAAQMMGEDLELLEAIVWNDDNLSYGSIITVSTGPDECITALTSEGMAELDEMITSARITPKDWAEFLEMFVHDAELVARLKGQEPA